MTFSVFYYYCYFVTVPEFFPNGANFFFFSGTEVLWPVSMLPINLTFLRSVFQPTRICQSHRNKACYLLSRRTALKPFYLLHFLPSLVSIKEFKILVLGYFLHIIPLLFKELPLNNCLIHTTTPSIIIQTDHFYWFYCPFLHELWLALSWIISLFFMVIFSFG